MLSYTTIEVAKNIDVCFIPSQTVIENVVWHSHNFILPCITVEEYFIISMAFIFNPYFLCFVVDEFPAIIINVHDFLT